jgi:GntR family transcriptional regulator, transcriptional repressor for pyruvate dehydrogenase complex
MTFKPQPVARAREQVETQIREAILSGTFKRGEKLPSEAELAESFAVSRTTVREALRSLAAAGLIFKVPGASGGSFVQVIDYRSLSGVLGDSIVNTLRLGTVEYDEVAQVRYLLEVPSAKLAAANRTEEDVETLRTIVDRQKEITFDHPDVPRLDIDFHSAIGDASGNRVLASFVTALHQAIRPVLAKHLDAKAARDTVRQHAAIVKAISEGDVEAAAGAMEKHLNYLQKLRDVRDGPTTSNGSRKRGSSP